MSELGSLKRSQTCHWCANPLGLENKHLKILKHRHIKEESISFTEVHPRESKFNTALIMVINESVRML